MLLLPLANLASACMCGTPFVVVGLGAPHPRSDLTDEGVWLPPDTLLSVSYSISRYTRAHIGAARFVRVDDPREVVDTRVLRRRIPAGIAPFRGANPNRQADLRPVRPLGAGRWDLVIPTGLGPYGLRVEVGPTVPASESEFANREDLEWIPPRTPTTTCDRYEWILSLGPPLLPVPGAAAYDVFVEEPGGGWVFWATVSAEEGHLYLGSWSKCHSFSPASPTQFRRMKLIPRAKIGEPADHAIELAVPPPPGEVVPPWMW